MPCIIFVSRRELCCNKYTTIKGNLQGLNKKPFCLVPRSALTETNGCTMQQVVNFAAMTPEVDVDREMEPRRDFPLNKLLDNMSSSLYGVFRARLQRRN